MNILTVVAALLLKTYLDKTYRLVEHYRFHQFMLAHLDGPGWRLTEVRPQRHSRFHSLEVAEHIIGQALLAQLNELDDA